MYLIIFRLYLNKDTFIYSKIPKKMFLLVCAMLLVLLCVALLYVLYVAHSPFNHGTKKAFVGEGFPNVSKLNFDRRFIKFSQPCTDDTQFEDFRNEGKSFAGTTFHQFDATGQQTEKNSDPMNNGATNASSSRRVIQPLDQNEQNEKVVNVDDPLESEDGDEDSDQAGNEQTVTIEASDKFEMLKYLLMFLGWKSYLRRLIDDILWIDRWLPPQTQFKVYAIGFDATVPFCDNCGNRPREEYFVDLRAWMCGRCADILQRNIDGNRLCDACGIRPAEEVLVSTGAHMCHSCANDHQQQDAGNNGRAF